MKKRKKDFYYLREVLIEVFAEKYGLSIEEARPYVEGSGCAVLVFDLINAVVTRDLGKQYDCKSLTSFTYGDIEEGVFSCQANWVVEKAHQLLRVVCKVSQSRLAMAQVQAIEKILNAEKYAITARDLEEFTTVHYTAPSLARGWELRRKMSYLSNMLSPADPNATSLLSGPVLLRHDNRLMNEEEFQKNSQYWVFGTTLQSMAIRMYQAELKSIGIELDRRTLELDLKKVEAWHKKHPQIEGQEHGVMISCYDQYDVLPTENYSEDWKKFWRKKRRREKGTNKTTKLIRGGRKTI